MLDDLYIPVYAGWDMSLYEIDFLISRDKSNRGLKMLFCDGALPFCPVREESLDPVTTCLNCQKTQKRNFNLIKEHSSYRYVRCIKYSIVDDLLDAKLSKKRTEIENFTKSTLVTFRKSEAIAKSDFLYSKIQKTIYDSFKIANLLIDKSCGDVILFNGRMARYWPFKETAKLLNKNVFITEAPLVGVKNMLITTKNYLHDQKEFSNELYLKSQEIYSDNVLRSKLSKLAEKWYEQRTSVSYSSFSGAFNNRPFITKYHIEPLDLSGKDPNSKLVSFFVSSPFDLANIDEKIGAFDGDQVDMIKALSEIDNIYLVVRLHPNMESSGQKFYNRLVDEINKPIQIIKPEQKVNSYELVNMSDVIVSAGSTINAEAAYLGKKSILCGSAPYLEFGISLVVNDPKALKSNFKNFNNRYWREATPEVLKSRAINYGIALQALGHRPKRIFRILNRNVLVIRGKLIFAKTFFEMGKILIQKVFK